MKSSVKRMNGVEQHYSDFHRFLLVVIRVQKLLDSHYNNAVSSIWHPHCGLMSRNQYRYKTANKSVNFLN